MVLYHWGHHSVKRGAAAGGGDIMEGCMNNLRIAMLAMITGLWLLPGVALATTMDVGDIALIEDVDGSITNAAMFPNVFLSEAACEFYNTGHPDAYDALFVFATSTSPIQQGWTVKSTTEGIGRTSYDSTATFCASSGRLRITVNMGNIGPLPMNPDDNAPIVLFYPLDGIELMAHEFGHHWMASVNFDRGNGVECLLRGYEPTGSNNDFGDMCSGGTMSEFNQHWSYNFNSCSLMYGSCIEDLGGGQFRYTYNDPKYSQLDQYLMGLRSADEVDPMFVVDTGELSGTASLPMPHGNTVEHSGTRVDVTIDDIIRQEGPRNPVTDQCHWKAAIILVHAAGTHPTAEDIQKVENYRVRWEEYYDWATDHRGSFDTRLDGCGTGTATCTGEPSAQCGATPDGDTDVADEEVPPNCTPGEQRCNGDRLVQCNAEYMWALVEDCSMGGGTCTNNACVYPDGDDDTVVADGDDADTADKDTVTENAEAALCIPGALRCSGTMLERCGDDGGAWNVYTDCAPRACENGTCVDGGGDTDDETTDGGSSSGCAGSAGMWAALMLTGLFMRRRR